MTSYPICVDASVKAIPPSFSKVFPRTRLFHRLDSAGNHPIIWIASPAGSGKTVAISSYLATTGVNTLWYVVDKRDDDPAHFFFSFSQAAQQRLNGQDFALPLLTPEYLAGVDIFAHNYFEEFFRSIKSATTIVIDNYQDLAPTAQLHEIFRIAFDGTPPEISFIIISRQEPPAVFAKQRVYGKLLLLDWNDLKLNPDEAQGIADLRLNTAVAGDLVAKCYRQSQGWLAGFILLLDYKVLDTNRDSPINNFNSSPLFDYFATEVFGRLSPDCQAVLSNTIFLPFITPFLLEKLTENPEAISILKKLHRDSFFLAQRENREPTYEFHPLFREFLLRHAREYQSPGQVAKLQARTAYLLHEAGYHEDAAPTLIELGDWETATRVLQQLAPMLLQQGRFQLLAAWLSAIPESVLRDFPWLSFFRGCSLLPTNPTAARQKFEQAFNLFIRDNDAIGSYLSWCSVIDCMNLEWRDFSGLDVWIDSFNELRTKHPVFPSLEIKVRIHTLLMGMLFAQPQHCELIHLVKSARQILESGDAGHYGVNLACNLMHYYHYIGDISTSTYIMDLVEQGSPALTPPAISVQLFDVVRANHYWLVGDGMRCLELVAEGLKRADSMGIHICDPVFYAQGVYGCLVKGDIAGANTFLAGVQKNLRSNSPLEAGHYHFLQGLIDAQSQNWKQAKDHLTIAQKLAGEAGCHFPVNACRIFLAQIHFQLGDADLAEEYLAAALSFARQMGSDLLECEILLARAQGNIRLGHWNEGLNALKAGLALNRQCDKLVAAGWWGPQKLSALYAMALAAEIEIPYVQGLIRLLNLAPPEPANTPKHWPWPIRLRTFGRFEIHLDGNLFKKAGKSQRKPIELLKALIAFGGENVPETKLCEAVWPDAEGDSAHRDFSSALYRLRRLIGNDKALRIENACLSLDRNVVWLDIWYFDSSLEKLHTNQDAEKAADALLDVYCGEFLPEESAAWVLSSRQLQHSKFKRATQNVGLRLESLGKYVEAIDWYLRVLERDSSAEIIYCRLMNCYAQQGLETDALNLYRQYKQILSLHGLQPGTELQSIHNRLSKLL